MCRKSECETDLASLASEHSFFAAIGRKALGLWGVGGIGKF